MGQDICYDHFTNSMHSKMQTNLLDSFCIQDSAKYVILAFSEGSLFSEHGLKQVPKLYTDSQWNVKIYELR